MYWRPGRVFFFSAWVRSPIVQVCFFFLFCGLGITMLRERFEAPDCEEDGCDGSFYDLTKIFECENHVLFNHFLAPSILFLVHVRHMRWMKVWIFFSKFIPGGLIFFTWWKNGCWRGFLTRRWKDSSESWVDLNNEHDMTWNVRWMKNVWVDLSDELWVTRGKFWMGKSIPGFCVENPARKRKS